MNLAVYSKPLNLHSVGCEVWIAGGTISSSFPHPHALLSHSKSVDVTSQKIHFIKIMFSLPLDCSTLSLSLSLHFIRFGRHEYEFAGVINGDV
jgi:hypothetical protein